MWVCKIVLYLFAISLHFIYVFSEQVYGAWGAIAGLTVFSSLYFFIKFSAPFNNLSKLECSGVPKSIIG